jgi:hypothetical protein
MFSAARYLVLDDQPEELELLVRALHGVGAPCVGIHYQPPAMPAKELFDGVRILFSDLKMLGGTANPQQDFDNIAAVLDNMIGANHGPYILILWTSHEYLQKELAARLEKLLDKIKLPIAVLALDKNKYKKDGKFTQTQSLQDDLREKIRQSPTINALLSWERDVLRSANATLAVLGSMVNPAEQTFDKYPTAVGKLLGRLAEAGLGTENAAKDPRGGVNAMLAPVLIDRLLNQSIEPGDEELWQSAVKIPASGSISVEQRAKLNRMLHLAIPPTEVISKTDWGAALPLSVAQLEDEAMRSMFGATKAEILEEFKVPAADLAKARIVLIRAGAACDQAQEKSGPIPFMLAVLAPNNKKNKPGLAVLTCEREIVHIDDDHGVEVLMVHARFSITLVKTALAQFGDPLFRLREPLLMKILFHVSSHAMRPGTLTL